MNSPMPLDQQDLQDIAAYMANANGTAIEDELNMLHGACCAKWNYMSSGPGYFGPLLFVCYDGSPNYYLCFTRDRQTGHLRHEDNSELNTYV